jgi:type 1 glutamine amidotransferase
MTWIIPYGRGRVVTTLLGHQWRDQQDSDALDCIGFRTVFTRAVEWAATQRVTIPVPARFPTADALSLDRRPGAPTPPPPQSPLEAR